jgi:hypothetical protein
LGAIRSLIKDNLYLARKINLPLAKLSAADGAQQLEQ